MRQRPRVIIWDAGYHALSIEHYRQCVRRDYWPTAASMNRILRWAGKQFVRPTYVGWKVEVDA